MNAEQLFKKYPIKTPIWTGMRATAGYTASLATEASTLAFQPRACPDCHRPIAMDGGLCYCTGKCGWSSGDPTKSSTWLDPWNRTLPPMTPVKGSENETISWEGATTVAGHKIRLVILND